MTRPLKSVYKYFIDKERKHGIVSPMRTTKFYNKVEPRWLLVDAKDQVLGRLSVQIARLLLGKHRPQFTPNFMTGDKVVVINAKHIRVTGKKMDDKTYMRYSGYPSGNKVLTLRGLQEKNPCKVIYHAVKGMLPKKVLGKYMMRSLKIYAEGEHEQQAQNPQLIKVMK